MDGLSASETHPTGTADIGGWCKRQSPQIGENNADPRSRILRKSAVPLT